MWRRSRFRETILEMEEDVNETRRIRNVSWYGGGRKEWKEYFEDLYNIDTHEELAVHRCCFVGIQRCTYFGGEPI